MYMSRFRKKQPQADVIVFLPGDEIYPIIPLVMI